MKHISIAVPPEGALVNSIVRLFKICNVANNYATGRGKESFFDVHLVGGTRDIDLYGGQFSIKPDLTWEDTFETNLIIIPALAGNIAEGLQKNIALIPWIKEQYGQGVEIASLCTAVFLLPATGLIHDSNCTAQWFVEPGFRKEFTQINLIAEKVLIDEETIHTNGGAYSFIDLLLKSTAGKEVAKACSHIFKTEFNRECQSLVTIVNRQKENKQPARSRTGERITMEKFAAMFVSKSRDTAHPIDEYLQSKYVNETTDLENTSNEAVHNNSKTIKKLLKKLNGL